MLVARYAPYRLEFKRPAGTSRGVLRHKETYFIQIFDDARPDMFGLGECAIFRGLGADDIPDYETRLARFCHAFSHGEPYDLSDLSSVRFGIETALADYHNGCSHVPYPSEWTDGLTAIITNGLVWMNPYEIMLAEAQSKAAAGFSCIKFKIGAIDFDREIEMIDRLRCQYAPERLQIRVDANGAFGADDVMDRLRRLAPLDIHSIEQPVRARQPELMSFVCANSPIPVALDEELIGISSARQMHQMLATLRPQYIVLKPSLCGGFSGATQWIDAANRLGIGHWITSALESNVGLNAIAQWTAARHPHMAQGLGTGALYTNNIPSPLLLRSENLYYQPSQYLTLPLLNWQ